MDSLRPPSKGMPKQSSASSSNLNNFSIRFNATDDSLDDIYNTSLPPPTAGIWNPERTPQQPPTSTAEEPKWKRDFLQASFFSRKRSNSIENNSLSVSSVASLETSGPVAAGPAGGSSSSVPMDTTTWARFKGKVNQAMEDIKSSSTSQKVPGNGTTASSSVNGSQTAQSSLSEDYADPEPEESHDEADNSDDDVDSEIFNVTLDEVEPPASSRLKRSIRHIRSNKEAIKGSLRKAKETTKDKIMFGRSKKTETTTTAVKVGDTSKKSSTVDPEIESGVEMVEDMVLPATKQQQRHETHSLASSGECKVRTTPNELLFDEMEATSGASVKTKPSPTTASSLAHLWPIIISGVSGRNCALSLGLLAVLLVLPIPPFLQGVIACLFSIVTISTLYQMVCSAIVALVSQSNPLGPQRVPFTVPNYDTMSVCEIPAAEEHSSLKCYSGWLNEIHSYDPDNYRPGTMKSVFVRLNGTRLRVSNVANRVPKRSMWNETPVEMRHLLVTMERTFDLRNCRVEMMPKGLARKRYFNRKYPMQLIIPNGGVGLATLKDEVEEKGAAASAVTPEGDNSPEGEKKLLFLNDFDSTDFGTTILTADTSSLVPQNQLRVPETSNPADQTPSSDEVRLIFFVRCDREKEDWYRRFQAASVGRVRDSEHPSANYKYVSEKEAQATRLVTQHLENLSDEERPKGDAKVEKGKKEAVAAVNEEMDESEMQFPPDSQFDGLLMTPCSARSHPDYVKFMAKYQSACKRKDPRRSPVASPDRKSRRERKEDDLWKGIDQSLFLGPTSDVIWANVLIGRVLYSCLNNDPMLEKVQDFLQKKLSAIKLPNFMEDVTIAQLCLGDKPPLIHRVSQPLMDERGTWIDADLTYEGLVHATVTTKLNLLRLRRQQGSNGGHNGAAPHFTTPPDVAKKSAVSTRLQMSSIYDSDAESTGGSSSESEGSAPASTLVVDSAASVAATIGSSGGAGVEVTGAAAASSASNQGGGGGGRKLLRIVDKITASNLFQSATEISYVQRAMENMSTRIKLRVELKGLVARVVLNIPPPPSDRIWVGFRGPPRLWITAKPALGEHSVDWSLVTNVIENKLCEEVYKYLVYPNMVDVIVPILGHSTYTEDD